MIQVNAFGVIAGGALLRSTLLLCSVGIIIRLLTLYWWPSVVHPDEIFQYQEQATRLLRGDGLVPWEYMAGTRNWLLPGVIAAAMWVGELIYPPPLGSQAGLSALLIGMSTIPIICGILWGNNVAGRPGAIAAGVLNATWFEIVHFSIHSLAETFATAALVGGLYILCPGRPIDSGRRIMAGACLLGIATVCRLQLAPVVLLACVALHCQWIENRYRTFAIGLCLPIIAGGLIDWATWGWPFHSAVLAVYYNLFVGMASHFGVEPWWYYASVEIFAWGPFAILIVIFVVCGARQLPILLLASLTVFAIHCAIGHKEYRFISPALPLIMTLAGVGSADAVARVRGIVGWQERPLLLPLGWVAVSALLAVIPPHSVYWLHMRGATMAARMVNADTEICGLGVLPAANWYRTTGYTSLRPGMRMYGVENALDSATSVSFNALLTVGPAEVTDSSFQPLACWNDPNNDGSTLRTCLWRRPGSCTPGIAPDLSASPGPTFSALLRRDR